MKTKVLFIMHLPPPVHGAAVVGKNIFESKVINDKFDCSYINLSASSEVKEIGKLGLSKVKFLFYNIWDVYKTVKKEKPKLCYVTPSSWDWGFYRDFVLIMILKFCKCKIVVHFHNKGVESWAQKPVNRFLYTQFFKNIKVILLAEELYSEKKQYVNRSDLFICPNGIKQTLDIQTVTKVTELIAPRFLFLSNMMEEKGVWVLLEACKILRDKGHVFKCDFVGRWVDISESEFYRKVKDYALENFIEAHGPQYGDEKNKFFENATVFVFPTFYHGETFGLVLLEAMEYGLPCVSTTEGGIPSVVQDGITGLLVEPTNFEALSEKMIELIKNPDLQLKMGQAGRERFLQNFTLEIFENNFTFILEKCI